MSTIRTTAFAEPPSAAATTLVAPAARHPLVEAPPAPAAVQVLEEPPLVAAPNDDELYWYLGRQQRWVQVVSVISFALAASSLVKFSLTSPWLYPLLIVLAITVGGSILSMISGLNQRRFSKASHVDLTDLWDRSTPTEAVPSVDVFLPSCGEEMAVLRNTFTHVARMQWRGALTVWVLDDADKREVEDLAAEFGFEYRVRPDRGHMKKAGNLRAGYGQSNGDFIVIFDADFCPRADFLSHTIPYMDDPEVAIVQTPQFFDTKESMNWLERTAGATQELFYRFVQPSRDRANAPICVGTCAVYRRAALQKAGGFAQIEHSEDVHTGIKLTTAGYVVRYVPIVVSRGLCPSDLAGFLNQQYRWCNGSMTLLASGQASRKPLSVRQRISFWSGFMYYISTALNVFFLHVPGVLMAVFFAAEVRASNYIPFLAGMWMYFVVMPRISKSRWRYEVLRTQMAYSFCHALAIVHKLTGRTAGWVATGAVSKSSSLARSISMVGIVTLSSTLLLSWGALFRDVAEYGWAEFWTMGLFLAAYSYLAIPLLASFIQVRSGRMPRRRADVIVPAPLPTHR